MRSNDGLKDEYIGRGGLPVVDQFADMGGIDVRNLGQRRRHERGASVLADEVGDLIPRPAFENGDGLVFHRYGSQDTRRSVPWRNARWIRPFGRSDDTAVPFRLEP